MSRIVSAAFPNARRKMCSATKCYVYYGIAPIPGVDMDATASRSFQRLSEESLVGKEMPTLSSNPIVPCHSMPSVQSQLPMGPLAVDARREINWDSVFQTLADELEAVRVSGSLSLLDGPVSLPSLEMFSVREIQQTLETYSPRLWTLLQRLVHSPCVDSSSEASARTKATISESLILKHRDPRASGMQLLTTFMLIAKGTNKEVITHLNHMGVCMSYSQAWRRLKSIASDPAGLQQLVDKPLLWVYDNLNIYQRVHHERSG